MIVTSHQPDLLPYTGFWHKMDAADLLDLKIHDQFQASGYQRRVLMRGTWASVPVTGNPRRAPIQDVLLVPEAAATVLGDILIGRYRGSRHWDDVGPWLLDLVREAAENRHLWHFNLHLLLGVRDRLGITTPVAVAPPPHERRSARLVESLRRYGADTYLAGPGGRSYMGDCAEFTEAGIAVRWSAHAPSTSDSIVSVLMDHDDPLAVVRATREDTPDAREHERGAGVAPAAVAEVAGVAGVVEVAS